MGLRGLEPEAFSRAIEVEFHALDLVLVRRLAKRYGRDASEGLEALLRDG